MYLNQALKSLGKKCPKVEFNGISYDSRNIKRKNIFFAIQGNRTSGLKFLKEVEKKGASAIIFDKKIKLSNGNIPFIKVKNVRKNLSEACSNFYRKKPKNIIAVTGTNGKTSVADFFIQILNLNKIRAASIGTLGIQSQLFKKKTFLTSIDPISLHKYLHHLAKLKINNVIVEASSHGLHQNRLDYLKLKAGIFTNLSHDHLDYHKNIKNYLNSKLYLFKSILPKDSDLITDSNIKEFKQLKKISSFKKLKLKTIGSRYSNLKILNHYYEGKNQHIKILYNSKIYNLTIPLIGFLQCKNLLMSILAANSVGLKFDKILKTVKKLKPVKGRLEYLGSLKNNSKVILDFAHTPDALEKSLKTIKNHFNSKLSVLFGCGGERDKNKRAIMGNIARKYCEKIFITDDNPRNENPSKIRSMIMRKSKKFFLEIPSRKKAIVTAIKQLKVNEVLLVAGKGHEEFQDYGKYKIKFSDRKIIKNAIKKNNALLKKFHWKFNILKNSFLNKSLKEFKFNRISIDSKKIKKNNLFIAIKGKKKDGHNFVKSALVNGAVKAIVSRKLHDIPHNRQIKISNTHHALNIISKTTRDYSNSKIIGITGSSGKTTLKNLLSFILSKYGKTHSSPKSYNNHYGVPLSICNLNKDTKYGVFEIGMSKKGEIDSLSAIVRPHIGAITNISEAHTKNFNNLRDIAKAKAEILNNISYKGHIILNKDDQFFDYLCKIAEQKKLNILSFSLKKKSDVYLKKITKNEKYYKLIVNIKRKDYEFFTNSNFNTFIQNILLTLSIIYICDLDLKKIKKSFLNFNVPQGRGDISKVFFNGKIINFIDESYNANPHSMKCAIKNFDSLKNYRGSKILILGDMLELGSNSRKYHRELAREINKSNIDKVYVFGNYIKETFNKLKKQKKGEIFKKLNYLERVFKKDLNNKDIVMIKGSNATGLFKFSQKIKKGKIHAI